MLKLGFLASRNGTSFRAIAQACAEDLLAASPVLLVTNTAKAEALAFARAHGIATKVIPTVSDPEQADRALSEALTEAGADLVILSGYLRKLGPITLSQFRNRVLNIHPGPLPDFGGEGMYGRRVHEAVIAAGVAETCATVHLVDEVYDHGAIIDRAVIEVSPQETADSLEAKVAEIEPRIYVTVLSRIISGELKLPN